jgi:hypothetical protein
VVRAPVRNVGTCRPAPAGGQWRSAGPRLFEGMGLRSVGAVQPEVAVWLLRVAPPAYDRADGNRTEVVMGRGTLTRLWSRLSP